MSPRRPGRAALLASFAALLALAAVAAAPAAARPPDADWRTVRSAHFRVHYPAPAEAWAHAAAARLEAVRERVVREVGYAPPEVVDVLVVDPIARPNGQALPLLGRPRMILFTTAPGPEDVIGNYRDWGEILLVHEEVHLAHMLRPSRSPWQRALSRLLPFGPITRRSPRWLYEGYATLLEGRLTGSGRPHGDLRAAVLRQRALAGRLPSYGALAGGDDSWLGGSMAYLAGSAFLEWLADEAYPPPGALPGADPAGDLAADPLAALWARMTARADRSFDDAFRGVFGAAPAEAWGRFTAEVSWRAVEVARALGDERVEGELWQDATGRTGPPAVSPDGERLAVVLRPAGGDRPPRLVVWPTTPDPEAAARRAEERRRLRDRDPEDVPALEVAPPAAEPLAVLPTLDRAPPSEPRWLPDGRALVLVRDLPDARGLLHPDLFLWYPDDDRLVRLTRQAGLRSPDPAPGGERAIAVRSRDGRSQLVWVDLATGAVAEETPPALDRVWATPRIAPGGERLAAVVHRDGRWRLVVRELAAGGREAEEREVPVPADAQVAAPAWSPDGRHLYATLGERGFVDLWRFPVGAPGEAVDGPPERLTRALGGALAPAPLPDGSALFFLGLEHDGLDLRRLELGPAALPSASAPALDPAVLAPAVRPPPPEPALPLAAAEVGPPRPYGAGPQAVQGLFGFAASHAAWAGELGVAGGDPVGRLSWLAVGAAGGDGALEGAVAAGAWRGGPVELSASVFTASEAPSEQSRAAPATVDGRPDVRWDVERRGATAGAAIARRRGSGGWRLGLDLALAEVEAAGAASLDTRSATLSGGLWDRSARGRWEWPLELSGRWEEGSTDDRSWRRTGGRAAAALLHGARGVGAAWERHDSADVAFPFDRYRVGGLPGTVLPTAADGGRLPRGALPAAGAVADEVERRRLELYLDGRDLPLFWERWRLWSADGRAVGEIELAGVELRGALPPIALLPLPGMRYEVGAAYVLEGPGRDDVRAWAGLAWRP